jgi:hypothetical protein
MGGRIDGGSGARLLARSACAGDPQLMPPSSEPQMYTLKSAAAECGVDPKTIRRHLPLLAEHGAVRNDDGVWVIPMQALMADARLRPDRPSRQQPPRGAPISQESVSGGEESPPPLPELVGRLRVEIEHLRAMLARADAQMESERNRADALEYVVRNGLPVPELARYRPGSVLNT